MKNFTLYYVKHFVNRLYKRAYTAAGKSIDELLSLAKIGEYNSNIYSKVIKDYRHPHSFFYIYFPLLNGSACIVKDRGAGNFVAVTFKNTLVLCSARYRQQCSVEWFESDCIDNILISEAEDAVINEGDELEV